MKRISKFLATTTFLLIMFNPGFSQNAKVEVIDFHSTNRCATCKAIEVNARKTVETYFADKGNVSFAVYNVDEKENDHIVQEFQATGTSLFLKITEDGKSQVVNLTQFAFMNGRNEEKFLAGLKEKIEEYL